MKRQLLLICTTLFCSAQALDLQGSLKGTARAGVRLGAFVVNASGTPQYEWASTALSGNTFALNLPDGAPVRGLWTLSGDTLTWPGVVGDIQVSKATATTELRLFAYQDADGNKQHSSNEKLLDTTLMAGKASLVLVYVKEASTVQGTKGLNVGLKAGWNVLGLIGGKTITAQVLTNVQDATLTLLE